MMDPNEMNEKKYEEESAEKMSSEMAENNRPSGDQIDMMRTNTTKEAADRNREEVQTEPAEARQTEAKECSQADTDAEKTVQSQEMPKQEGPSVREYCYEEKVKKTSKKKKAALHFAKFVSGCLIVSIVGGMSIGVGGGLIRHYLGGTSISSQDIVTNTVSTSSSASSIIQAVKPSVVCISTTMSGTTTYMPGFTIPYEAEGAGSGVIFYSNDSIVGIVTNNHVIEGANSIYVTLDGGVSVPAQVVGTDSSNDLAVLSISWDDLLSAGVDSVVTAVFGDSSQMAVGDSVYAIGNAMGNGISATDGIVSITEQSISVEGKVLNVIQTSAAINSGNSGGALINANGEVIGINTAKYNSSMAEGMGYAIPSNIVTPIMEQLLTNGTAPSPYIGITGTDISEENASIYRLPVGALVMEVEENSPAAKAGIQQGDVITEFDGKSVLTIQSLVDEIATHSVGDEVSVHLVRNGKEAVDVTLTIGDRNAQ